MSWLRRLLRRRSHASPQPADTPALLERAIAEYNARRWVEAEPLFREVIDRPTASSHDREVARNIYGRLLERHRRFDEAIAVYEASVADEVVGSHPYERLAGIYHKLGRREDELRVLGRTIEVVAREVATGGRPELGIPLGRLRTLLHEAASYEREP